MQGINTLFLSEISTSKGVEDKESDPDYKGIDDWSESKVTFQLKVFQYIAEKQLFLLIKYAEWGVEFLYTVYWCSIIFTDSGEAS